jgi:hypothetical protein
MTRRFYGVLRGFRGAAARQKYLDHLAGLGTQGENIGTKGSRPAQTELYVQPFGQDLPDDLFLRVSALTPSWTTLKTVAPIAARTKDTLAATAKKVRISKFKASRVVRRTKDATGTASTSKLTGLKYLKYNSTSISAPFGRSTATENEGEAFDVIRTAILASGNFSVTLIEEEI